MEGIEHRLRLIDFILLCISSLAVGCQSGIQPNYCALITLADYTYIPAYHTDNITYSTTPSFERDVNVGFGKAVQYDILRFAQLKGLCHKLKLGSVECFRAGENSSRFGIPLVKIYMKLSTSLSPPQLGRVLREMYESPPDPSFYRYKNPPEIIDVTRTSGRCGCS